MREKMSEEREEKSVLVCRLCKTQPQPGWRE